MATETLLPRKGKETNTAAMSSRTWKLDPVSGRLLHRIDGTEAIRQAVTVALSVPRYEHLIFSDQFGHELDSLIGRDPDYIAAAAPSLIRDALLPDDRIEAVEDLVLTPEGDNALVTFTVRAGESFAGAVELKGEK